MAVAIWRGNRPEVTLGWPDSSKDGSLRPWPLRGSSKRNLSLTMERDRPTEVPALAALWLAGVRQRSGPWFCIRFHPGEYQQLREALVTAGWGHDAGLQSVMKRRGARGRRRAWRRARRVGTIVKARDVLRYLSPQAREQFVEGCRKKYQAWSSDTSEEEDDLAGPVVSSDPLFGP